MRQGHQDDLRVFGVGDVFEGGEDIGIGECGAGEVGEDDQHAVGLLGVGEDGQGGADAFFHRLGAADGGEFVDVTEQRGGVRGEGIGGGCSAGVGG